MLVSSVSFKFSTALQIKQLYQSAKDKLGSNFLSFSHEGGRELILMN